MFRSREQDHNEMQMCLQCDNTLEIKDFREKYSLEYKMPPTLSYFTISNPPILLLIFS